VTLRRDPWVLPETLPFGDTTIKPLRAGESLTWRLQAG
jgi:dihydroorotase